MPNDLDFERFMMDMAELPSKEYAEPEEPIDESMDDMPNFTDEEIFSDPDILSSFMSDLNEVGGGDPAGTWSKLKYGFHKMPSDLENLAILAEAAGASFADYQAGADQHYGPMLNFDAKREVLAQERKDRIIANDKGMVAGTEEEDSWWVTGGNVAGALATPTTLLPIGQSYKAAALIGMGLGMWEATLYGLAQEGKINGTDVALAATAGAVLAPLVMAAGSKFTSFLRVRSDNNIPVTAADIDDFVGNFNIKKGKLPPSKDLAEEINISLGIGLPKRKVATAKADMKAAIKDDPEMTEFFRRYADDKDTLRHIAKNQKEKDIEAAWELRENNNGQLLKKIELEKAYRDKVSRVQYTKDSDVDKAYKEATTENIKGYQNDIDLIEDPKGGLVLNNASMEKAFNTATAARDISVETYMKDLRKQGGYIQQDVMQHIAGSSLGAAAGYAWNEEEGAVVGAIMGLGLPYLVGKTIKVIGKLGDKEPAELLKKFGSEMLIQRPAEKFKSLGKTGRVFAAMVRNAQEDVDIRMGIKMHQLEGPMITFKKNKGDMSEISRIAQKTLLPKDASPEARKIAASVERDFKEVLNESVSVGVLTKEAADVIARKAAKEGYWPRMFNEAFLSTSKGKERWVDVMTEQQWSKSGLENTVNTILGTNRKEISNFISKVNSSGNVYVMSRAQAIKLWEGRGKNLKVSRSGHLEHSRTIHVQTEETLKPFLIDDPHVVLTEYFHDVYKRIEMARMFGAKDQRAVKILQSMEDEYGAAVADSARTVYYTVVGDSSKSWVVKRQVEMSQWAKNVIGRVNAYETLKLTFAQSINMGQATVNGSILVARMSGNPATAIKVVYKGIRATFTKEGRDFAARSGAAAETTLLEVVGEASQMNHTIWGRQVWAPLEILNNPTKFLKATGFISIEKLQRKLAANIGKSFVEDLLGKKSHLLAQVKTKANISRLKKINVQLDELGVPSELLPTKVTENHMLRAGLRFSNVINFRNTPDQLPVWWQSPDASIFRKLKTFAFHHGAFVKDNVLKPAFRGNFAPAFMYLAVGTPIGMTVDEFRRLLRGDDKELTILARVLRGFVSVGGLGILMDTAYSAVYSSEGIGTSLAGVVISDISKVVHGLSKSVSASLDRGEIVWKPMAKALHGTVVSPGSTYVRKEYLTEGKKRKSGLGGSLGGSKSSLGGSL